MMKSPLNKTYMSRHNSKPQNCSFWTNYNVRMVWVLFNTVSLNTNYKKRILCFFVSNQVI